MILKSITAKSVGPFYRPATLEFEDDLTVITGSNDAGKSSLLRLIGFAYEYDIDKFGENDVNFDRNHEADTNWALGNIASCDVVVRTNEKPWIYFSESYKPDQLLRLEMYFGAGKRIASKIESLSSRGEVTGTSPNNVIKLPRVLYLPAAEQVKEVIHLSNPNRVEVELLRVAFGPAFSYDEKLKNLAPVRATQEFKRAERNLNTAIKQLLPPSLHLEFQLASVENDRSQMALMMVDRYEGQTSLGLRGSGIQTVVTLIGLLLRLKNSDEQLVILYDEPENHLHPDAQHILRRVLEELAALPTIQVIYTTHSPAMINTWRGRSVRLLERTMVDDRATTVIHNRPIEGNYQKIRSSLGMTPADSLLYAPVLLLVEGITEALCLPTLFDKLEQAQIADFARASLVLSQIHLMDGGGDTFKKMCRLAISQGAKPVIFLDGDKERASNEVRRDFPDVPVIELPRDVEFEEIVPQAVYFQALRDVLDKSDLSEQAFAEWIATNAPGRRLFSKQIASWIYLVHQVGLNKGEVMKRAVELVTAEQIQKDELRRLLNAIEGRINEA